VFYITAFILGSIWGSFSNVCINRIPKNISILTARSFCLSCNKKINWYDNIPLFSFIILKAKCRHCSTKINLEYFLVELISAINFLVIFYFFGLSFESLLLIVLSVFFVIIFFIDLRHFIIPNELTFSLMALGFIKSFLTNPSLFIFPDYIQSLIGGITGYFVIWFIIFIYKKLKDVEGMGLGDAKLLSALGFWFGWIALPFILIFSSVIALVIAIPSLINKSKNMRTQIPFGPYLILGCLFYLFFNDQIIKFLS